MSQQPATKRSDELQRLGGEPLDTTSDQLQVPERGLPAFALGSQGLVINTLNDAWTFANIAFRSGLTPESLKSPAQVLIALQMGMEVGLPPMAAIQNVAVINGRPSLWGDVMLGLCRASGKFDEAAFSETYEYDKEGPDRRPMRAICTVRRLPNGNPITKEFSWQDVLQAKLNSKDTYQKYPGPMMMNRARAFALRAGFSDILKGVVTAEEARDLPEKNITPQPATSSRPTNLEELTEHLSPSETSAETAMATETPAQGATEPTPSSGESTGAEVGSSASAQSESLEDPFAALKRQLEECRTVPDVTRVRNSLTGPASKLTDKEKADINAICESRAEAIRAARKTGGSQQSLV
jgi:hypothetical protein